MLEIITLTIGSKLSNSVLPAIGLKWSKNSDALILACNSSNNPLRIVAVLMEIFSSKKRHTRSCMSQLYLLIYFLSVECVACKATNQLV